MKSYKKRILIFAYDGTGVGHLMCLAKIASGLSSGFDVLIVTGHTVVSKVVKNGVRYIQLPNFYEELAKGNKSDADINASRIIQLHQIVKDFKPDAFITDFLPFGKRCELQYIIRQYKCLKYFTLRSEIGGERIMHEDVFSPRNIKLFAQHYDRIFVTSDLAITSMDIFSWLPTEVKKKITYTGFVTYPINRYHAQKLRQLKHSTVYRKWIVCSIGGGRVGNELLESCYKFAKTKQFTDCFFDIVMGEYNKASINSTECLPNVCISNWIDDLYMYHASADLVICCGAYNTLVECMQGLPKTVLSYSVQNPQLEDEQQQNIIKLGNYYSIKHIDDLENIEKMVVSLLQYSDCDKNQDKLNMNGIDNICNTVMNDIMTVPL
ncbi:hypothetical protein [Leyella stercorea]|uniref:hypothetical protein n=1 Tax=Leyella stercorea TaxID=363265 RepID=UPI00242C46E5|nr:hypothetical protein [Leyella stercorea]